MPSKAPKTKVKSASTWTPQQTALFDQLVQSLGPHMKEGIENLFSETQDIDRTGEPLAQKAMQGPQAKEQEFTGLAAESYDKPLTGKFDQYSESSLAALEELSKQMATERGGGAVGKGNELLDRIMAEKPKDITSYFDTVIQAPAVRAYNEQIVPTLDKKFAGNKRFGSEYMKAHTLGQRNLMEDLNKQRADVGYQAYQATKNRQVAGLQMAPSLAGAEQGQAAGYSNVLQQLTAGGELKRRAKTEERQAQYGEFERQQEWRTGQQQAGLTAAGQNIQRTALNQAQYATEESARLQREQNAQQAAQFLEAMKLQKGSAQMSIYEALMGMKGKENIVFQSGGSDNSGLQSGAGAVLGAGIQALPAILKVFGV